MIELTHKPRFRFFKRILGWFDFPYIPLPCLRNGNCDLTSQDLTMALKQGRRSTGAVSRLSNGLIVAQVALSLLILVGAGLFIRTLHNLQRVNLGFNQEDLLLFRLTPQQGGYKDEGLLQFYEMQFVYARLLSFFGGLALLLAAIGLYGVMAYSVAQRTNEIGIRMALGARGRDVLRLVIWQGMKLVMVGLSAGAAIGYALKRLVEGNYESLADWQDRFGDNLYGVTVADPWTFGVVAALLALVALAACYVPARRATRVDPMIVLRSE
jgi:FtsX-like permease family protein